MSPDERRLRSWLWDRTLSGDMLLEQNIHVVDICNWILGAHPISADARASRKVVHNFGNTNDNYEVVFTYPGDVEVVFNSTQFNRNNYFDVAATFFGSEGLAETPYKGPLRIQGTQPWTWSATDAPAITNSKFAADGSFSDNLAQADPMKDRNFIDSITGNKFQNQIAAGVESALSCMLARKSAEVGHSVTWAEFEKDHEAYKLGMDLNQFA